MTISTNKTIAFESYTINIAVTGSGATLKTNSSTEYLDIHFYRTDASTTNYELRMVDPFGNTGIILANQNMTGANITPSVAPNSINTALGQNYTNKMEKLILPPGWSLRWVSNTPGLTFALQLSATRYYMTP